MAEAEKKSSISEQPAAPAGEQKTVVIGIPQGQKVGVRTVRARGLQIVERIKTDVVRKLQITADKLWMGIERVRLRRKSQRPWRKRKRPQRDPVEAVAKEV